MFNNAFNEYDCFDHRNIQLSGIFSIPQFLLVQFPSFYFISIDFKAKYICFFVVSETIKLRLLSIYLVCGACWGLSVLIVALLHQSGNKNILGLTLFQGFEYWVWMLLTFNRILVTYYASQPNTSIGKTYVNLSMTLSIFAEHGSNKATGGNFSYYVCISVSQRMYRPRGVICR